MRLVSYWICFGLLDMDESKYLHVCLIELFYRPTVNQTVLEPEDLSGWLISATLESKTVYLHSDMFSSVCALG